MAMRVPDTDFQHAHDPRPASTRIASTGSDAAAGPDATVGRRLAAPHETLWQGRFETVGLTHEEARQTYIDRLDAILDTAFLAPFAADMDAYRMGALSVLRLTATARRSTRLAARIEHDRYDSIGVQYVVTGRATGRTANGAIASDPGRVMILDYGQPFVVTDLEPRTVVNVAVPRSLFPARLRDPESWHGVVLEGPSAALLASFLGRLIVVLDGSPAAAGPALAAAFVSLLAIALEDYDTDGPIDRDTQTIRRAENLVDDRLGSADLGPVWLATKLNLSRSELYTVMERFGGVARFIMNRRLLGARAALENPSDQRRIGAIAFAFGFSSEAHFARVFRATFGMTASEARRAAGGSAGADGGRP